MLRSALVAGTSAILVIAIASAGAFIIPMPDRDPIDFLYYVMLLIGMPVGTLLTLAFRDALGTSSLWSHVFVAAAFAVLNWILIGVLYGVWRQWTSRRNARSNLD